MKRMEEKSHVSYIQKTFQLMRDEFLENHQMYAKCGS